MLLLCVLSAAAPSTRRNERQGEVVQGRLTERNHADFERNRNASRGLNFEVTCSSCHNNSKNFAFF